MDVTQVQSSGAGFQTPYPPAADRKTTPATDVSNIGNAASSATTKTSGSLVVNANPSTSANAEIDKYVADLKSGQSLTIIYGLQQNTALKITNLGIASSAGLIPGPGGILYRPGVVNPYGTLPAPGTPEVHTINWGGYGSIQATPQPTQIINDNPTTFAAVDAVEILILPVQDAPNQLAAQQSSETVYTPAARALPLTGPVLVASRANLVPSTDPLAANNVEFGRGLQPPSSDFLYGPNPNPSPTSATPPQTNFVGKTTAPVLGTAMIEHVSFISYESSAKADSSKKLAYTAAGSKAGTARVASSKTAIVESLAKFLASTKSPSSKVAIHGGVTSIDIKA